MSQMHTQRELTFDLIDRLHKSLRLSGKSAVALANELGVHRNTINNYLSAKTPIDRRTLIAWALVTGVPVEWLEHGVVPDPNPDGGEPIPREEADGAVEELAARKRQRGRGHTQRYLVDRVAA